MAKTRKTPLKVELTNFNMGGLADSAWSGVSDSYYKLVGLDLHSTPGLLKVAQKLTKDSGTTVTEFCKVAVACSNGEQYWFSSTSGKIWARNSSGSWRLVYTTSPTSGSAACLGAMEYDGYIYWATENYLHRIAVSSATAGTWSPAANWANFSNGDNEFHPMEIQNGVLYIGDGNYVAQVDSGVFSANALNLESKYRISALGKIYTDLLIGTYTSDSVSKSHIFRWNTWSDSYTNSDEVNEIGINAFIPADNMVFVQAGYSGNIYFYNGQQLELYKKIPGNWDINNQAVVYPYSVATIGNSSFMGLSQVTGDPADLGVYQMGRHSRNYNYILDLPYPISERNGNDFVLSNIKIGAILAVGYDLYVAWENGSNRGIDKLDYSNKLDGAYLETRVMTVEREEYETFADAYVDYYSKPTNTDINIYYKTQKDSSYQLASKIDDSDRKFIKAQLGVEATTLQLKWVFTASGNNAPEIESGAVTIR